MKLYRSEDEVSVSGNVTELESMRLKIERIKENEAIEFTFHTDSNSEPYKSLERSMIVRADEGPAIAVYEKGVGVVVSGSLKNLEVFASFFDFEKDTKSGCHYHWDEACGSDYVADGTLSIVVAVE